MEPIVSVIIPYFNAASTLPEAVNSVMAYPDKSVFEIIIVNDGSTQSIDLQVLEDMARQGCRVIHQENKGQAAARNAGIKVARGRYILFLDSDNKIRPAYITKGIEVLDAHNDIAVVYGKPNFFGDTTTPRFTTAAFDLHKLLAGNYIDMCAVVRKSIFEQIGGLDENREVGHEDYDLWIRIAKAGWKLHFIDTELFDYRISNTSHSSEFQNQEKYLKMMQYLMAKHADIYLQCYRELYEKDVWKKQRPFKSLWYHIKNKYLSSGEGKQ
ncbi:glycosyltransferase [Mucilaginibacter koreensis]